MTLQKLENKHRQLIRYLLSECMPDGSWLPTLDTFVSVNYIHHIGVICSQNHLKKHGIRNLTNGSIQVWKINNKNQFDKYNGKWNSLVVVSLESKHQESNNQI